MSSTVITSDLIKKAMKTVGVIASNETPSAEELNDGFDTLNDVLEVWSTQGLTVFGSLNVPFNTQAGVLSYTIGAGGVVNVPRPVAIVGGYCTFNGVDFPIDIIDQGQYNRISLKTQQQQVVEKLLYVNDFPLGRVLLWPVPSAIIPMSLTCSQPLVRAASLATVLSYPPAYKMALQYALGVAIASSYGKTVPADVAKIAADTFGSVKNSNMTLPTMRFDTPSVNDILATWQTGI